MNPNDLKKVIEAVVNGAQLPKKFLFGTLYGHAEANADLTAFIAEITKQQSMVKEKSKEAQKKIVHAAFTKCKKMVDAALEQCMLNPEKKRPLGFFIPKLVDSAAEFGVSLGSYRITPSEVFVKTDGDYAGYTGRIAINASLIKNWPYLMHPPLGTTGEAYLPCPRREWYVRYVLQDMQFEVGPLFEVDADTALQHIPLVIAQAKKTAYRLAKVHADLRADGSWQPAVQIRPLLPLMYG